MFNRDSGVSLEKKIQAKDLMLRVLALKTKPVFCVCFFWLSLKAWIHADLKVFHVFNVLDLAASVQQTARFIHTQR